MQKGEKGRREDTDVIQFKDSNIWWNFKTAPGRQTQINYYKTFKMKV